MDATKLQYLSIREDKYLCPVFMENISGNFTERQIETMSVFL